MTKFAELIERLEKATGPDGELDLAITHALSNNVLNYATARFTASIDAALTLVPEGGYWSGDSRGCAIVAEAEPPETGKYGIVTGHPVPAIALCIAALKVQEAQP